MNVKSILYENGIITIIVEKNTEENKISARCFEMKPPDKNEK